jgi:uncharacterized protein YjdB
MKKIYGRIAVLALGLAILAACNNGLEAPLLEREAGTGTVSIVIDGASAAARTLAPAPASFTRYTATFSGPGSQAETDFTPGSPLNLIPGSWTITVTAYTGTVGSYTAVGRGATTITVAAGQSVTADVTIKPITDQGGAGTLTYAVGFPTVDNAILNLTKLDTNAAGTPIDLKTTASGSVSNLEPGYYLLRIALIKGVKTAGASEVVHIYKGLTTSATYNFTLDDFGASVTGISLDRTSAVIKAGGTMSLIATISPANATDKRIDWSTSNPLVAGVSSTSGSSGAPVTVTGGNASPTQVNITAASVEDGTKKAICKVDVINEVTGIINGPATATVGTGLTLSATIAPSNASYKAITWSVKNPGTTGATIGGLTTLNTSAPGTVIVTATVEKAKASANYTFESFSQDFTVTVQEQGSVGINVGFLDDAVITGNDGTNNIYKYGTPSSVTFTAPAEYTEPKWYVDGAAAPASTSSSFVINAADYSAQKHNVTFVGKKNDAYYGTGNIPFTVHDTPPPSFVPVISGPYLTHQATNSHIPGSLSGNRISFQIGTAKKNSDFYFFHSSLESGLTISNISIHASGGANPLLGHLSVDEFQITFTRSAASGGGTVTYYVTIHWLP